MESYPLNWVLIPGPAKTVHLFHHCFALDGKLLGIHGSWSTVPFKQVSLSGASSSISTPPIVRGKLVPSLPTLAQFLGVTDEEDFSTLVGKSENPISDLTRHPNSFWLHPQVYLAIAGPQSIRAA
jgi:hypothetical protein